LWAQELEGTEEDKRRWLADLDAGERLMNLLASQTLSKAEALDAIHAHLRSMQPN
jgi:hypothetical protein